MGQAGHGQARHLGEVVPVTEPDGSPAVLANEWGERTHASVVSFLDDGSVLVGNDAKKNIITNAENTIYSAKRLIGRFYFSDEVKKAQAVMPLMWPAARGQRLQ